MRARLTCFVVMQHKGDSPRDAARPPDWSQLLSVTPPSSASSSSSSSEAGPEDTVPTVHGTASSLHAFVKDTRRKVEKLFHSLNAEVRKVWPKTPVCVVGFIIDVIPRVGEQIALCFPREQIVVARNTPALRPTKTSQQLRTSVPITNAHFEDVRTGSSPNLLCSW